MQEWTLRWSVKTDAAIYVIEAFLDAAGGVSSFEWVTPKDIAVANVLAGYTVDPAIIPARLFLCADWAWSIDAFNINTLSATFREVPA
jgi:phage-related protein